MNSYKPTLENFEHTISLAISSHRTISQHQNRSNPPWWNRTCIHLLRLKRRFLKLARTFCSKDLWLKYKQTSAKLRKYIKFVSRQYWDNLCRGGCSKGTIFKLLKRLANRETTQGDNILQIPRVMITTFSQAQGFLEHYQQEDNLEPLPFDLSNGDATLDEPFTLDELSNALKNTRSTSPGADGVSAKLLKLLTQQNLKALLTIYNSLYDTATVPTSWKLALVVPIRKPGKPPQNVNSYRPIALTSVCCKLLEKMIVRRLLIWTGKRNSFHPCHFGFLPFRDCSSALCSFYNDILRARDANLYVMSVCLDIKAAYDSVWIDNLIYKLASFGICGKLGLWIANFLTDRSIKIRWKGTFSKPGPCRRGVPQGSVLSPFLFQVYMSDIFETLDDGVKMIVYADDIMIYAFGSDDDRVRRKLTNSLHNITIWCSFNKLSISPEKCAAINFSRHRDPGEPLKVLGHALPWCLSVKFLGVWFTRNLNFRTHFSSVRIKTLKRLNYLKAIANRSRGASSTHMLRIINSLIRSSLEFGCALFFDSAPTAINSLEIVYNAALRVATGLPMWTPIPVLRREGVASSISSRLKFLAETFLIRQLSLPSISPISVSVSSAQHSISFISKWDRLRNELCDTLQFDPRHVIRFIWPPLPHSVQFNIITHGLPFQDISLPDCALPPMFSSWCLNYPNSSIISTDASKDDIKTAIAAVNNDTGQFFAALTPHINSIFTAEALAIFIAITYLLSTNKQIIILTDSLSVLNAMNAFSLKSPKVILLLIDSIYSRIVEGYEITFIWCPAHKGITPNERADKLAKYGPYSCNNISYISPDDIRSILKKNWITENDYLWLNCSYAPSFPHLSSERLHPNWTPDRASDVLVARWRTRMIITQKQLYRFKLTYSPLCRFCYDLDTPEHILLECPFLTIPRSNLFSSLGFSNAPCYSDLLSTACSSSNGIRALIKFSRAASLL